MARRTTLSSLPNISEINMTPLMDLTFILLITFIITFPLIEQSVPINLPKGQAADLSPKDSRKISVDVQGTIYLDNQVVDLPRLAEEMKLLGTADPDTTVFVRADEMLHYGKVVEIMRILHGAGITRMALVTQNEGR